MNFKALLLFIQHDVSGMEVNANIKVLHLCCQYHDLQLSNTDRDFNRDQEIRLISNMMPAT